MEARLTPEKRQALAALVQCHPVTEAARQAGVSPGTVRRWLRDDATFLAARNAALSELDDRPRAALNALGQKTVAILREAMDGYAEPGEMKAAVEVIKLTKLNEPAPSRATDPADAGRQIARREEDEMMQELMTPQRHSRTAGDSDEEEADDDPDLDEEDDELDLE